MFCKLNNESHVRGFDNIMCKLIFLRLDQRIDLHCIEGHMPKPFNDGTHMLHATITEGTSIVDVMKDIYADEKVPELFCVLIDDEDKHNSRYNISNPSNIANIKFANNIIYNFTNQTWPSHITSRKFNSEIKANLYVLFEKIRRHDEEFRTFVDCLYNYHNNLDKLYNSFPIQAD